MNTKSVILILTVLILFYVLPPTACSQSGNVTYDKTEMTTIPEQGQVAPTDVPKPTGSQPETCIKTEKPQGYGNIVGYFQFDFDLPAYQQQYNVSETNFFWVLKGEILPVYSEFGDYFYIAKIYPGSGLVYGYVEAGKGSWCK
jgi:hypothetical protein